MTAAHVANLATALLCAVTVVALVVSYRSAEAVADDQPRLRQGDVSRALAALVPPNRGRALVVALSPGCGFCTDSLPFYRRLGAALEVEGSSVAMVGVFRNDNELERQRPLLEEAGVAFEHVEIVDFRGLQLVGTPTVILTDDRGEVLDLWLGKLDERKEQQVLEAIG